MYLNGEKEGKRKNEKYLRQGCFSITYGERALVIMRQLECHSMNCIF